MNYNLTDASSADMKRGFCFDEKTGRYVCLICGRHYNRGEIYEKNGRYFDAEKAVQMHVNDEHGSVFDCLIAQDKKRTGLTEVQKDLMTSFYRGLGDKEIAEKTGTSASTVRFQRYNLREKAKQARVYLVLAELMEESILNHNKAAAEINEVHSGATMVDERYMVTQKESEQILKQYFEPGSQLKLNAFPPKEKRKLVILKRIASEFEYGIRYNEKQVNRILENIYSDYATIRRYLLEYGFMVRTADCSEYWLKT